MRVVLLMLAIASAAWAAPPPKAVPLKVEGEGVVQIVKSLPCTVTAAPGASWYVWVVPPGVECTKNMNVLTVTAAPKGTHRITVHSLTIDFDRKAATPDEGTIALTVGDAPAPTPPGPNPPGPTPPPVPERPMRVLIVFEKGDLPKMTAEQRDGIINSAKFRAVLKDRTDKAGPNGRGWNMWDQNQEGVELMDPFWQAAFKRPRTALPSIHIFKGDRPVHDGALPATADETVTLLNKYAGG